MGRQDFVRVKIAGSCNRSRCCRDGKFERVGGKEEIDNKVVVGGGGDCPIIPLFSTLRDYSTTSRVNLPLFPHSGPNWVAHMCEKLNFYWR